MLNEKTVIERLASKGLELPPLTKPGGAYQPVRVLGGVAYVAAQFPLNGSKPAYQGRLGRELTTADGYAAARLTALNILAHIHAAVGFERILGLNRFEAYLQTEEPWDEFPKVLDGASDLFLLALGSDLGRHARAPFGVHRLSMNLPMELIATFTVTTE